MMNNRRFWLIIVISYITVSHAYIYICLYIYMYIYIVNNIYIYVCMLFFWFTESLPYSGKFWSVSQPTAAPLPACDALQGIMGGQPLAHLDMEDLVGKKTRKRSLLPTPLRFCLVVLTCFNHLENMSSSVGMMTFPIYGKIKCSKPRTSHLYLYTTVLVGFGINCIHLYTCLEPATVYYEALLFCWHQNSPGFQEAYGKIISFNTSTVSMIVGHNGYSGMYIMHQGFYLISVGFIGNCKKQLWKIRSIKLYICAYILAISIHIPL